MIGLKSERISASFFPFTIHFVHKLEKLGNATKNVIQKLSCNDLSDSNTWNLFRALFSTGSPNGGAYVHVPCYIFYYCNKFNRELIIIDSPVIDTLPFSTKAQPPRISENESSMYTHSPY